MRRVVKRKKHPVSDGTHFFYETNRSYLYQFSFQTSVFKLKNIKKSNLKSVSFSDRET